MSSPLPGYRRHKPSGQAVVTLSGRDFYLGPWKSKASIAELLLAYLNFAQSYYVFEGKVRSEYVCMKDALPPVRELYARTSETNRSTKQSPS